MGLARMLERGTAQRKYVKVVLFFDHRGIRRAEVTTETIFDPHKGHQKVGEYEGQVIFVRTPNGSWVVARDELSRIHSAIKLEEPKKETMHPYYYPKYSTGRKRHRGRNRGRTMS